MANPSKEAILTRVETALDGSGEVTEQRKKEALDNLNDELNAFLLDDWEEPVEWALRQAGVGRERRIAAMDNVRALEGE